MLSKVAFPSKHLITTFLSEIVKLTFCIPILCLLLCCKGNCQASPLPPSFDLYGINNDAYTTTGPNKLVRIDETTLVATPIGTVNIPIIRGIAHDYTSSITYAISVSGQLATLDISTGLATIVQTLNAPGVTFGSLAFEESGGNKYLYTANMFAPHQFYRITLAGNPPYLVQQLGTVSSGATGFQLLGMAVHPSNGTLYGSCRNTDGLVVLDKNTGQITNFLGNSGINNITGIAFDPSTDELYGTFDSGALAKYNLGTGVASQIATTEVKSSLAFAAPPAPVCQQTSDAAQQKYWFYRAKLINDFMLVGECTGVPSLQQGCGYSLPGSRRVPGGIGWGDTTIYLGQYIAVLATEDRLAVLNGGDPTPTRRELYYALKAFNRLDETAEVYWSNGIKPKNLNGWFIRDDVGSNFVANHGGHFNSGKFSSSIVTTAVSDFSQKPSEPTDESHDQVWHMMKGLALVRKFVDTNATYNGLNLRTEAGEIIKRMMSHMSNNGWIVKNPITNDCRSCGESKGKPNCGTKCGANAVGFAFGGAEAACKALNGFTWGLSLCSEFHNTLSYSLLPYWQAVKYIGANTIGEEDYKFQVLVAEGSSWNVDGIDLSGPFLGKRTEVRNFEDLALVYETIYNPIVGTGVPASQFQCLIDTAPCKGPANFGQGFFPHWEWSSTDRFIQPKRRGDYAPAFPGEYNGLDYMLLYNLYHLKTSPTIPAYDPCLIDSPTPPTTCTAPASTQCGCAADHDEECVTYNHICKKECKKGKTSCKKECRTEKHDCKKACKSSCGSNKSCLKSCKSTCKSSFKSCKQVCVTTKDSCKTTCTTETKKCNCQI